MKRKPIRKPKLHTPMAAVPCPECSTTLFFLYEDSVCKHLRVICPVCAYDFDISTHLRA